MPIGKGVGQGDTISPKLFTAALQWIMKSLPWEERGIRVDGRFLSNLRFTDDIVLFSSSTNEAETMLNELNEAKRIGLRINRGKTQFMKNAYCEDGGVQLEGFQIVETSSYVYLGRSMNMGNYLKEELNRRMRAAWVAFAAVRVSYGPTDGPRSSCSSVRLDSPSSALLRSGDVGRHRGHV
ncbi:hypothetical protein RB195_018606 [Necator americanus]|uniref:Reverse transcriptase domain-containing protein n=1 Tax=Necator americanus TaxID=51031 RepID=A0ABR1CBL7_NECAM